MIEDSTNLDEIIDGLNLIESKTVYAGIFGEEGSEIMIRAAVQEFGADIKVTPAMRGWFAAHGVFLKKSTEKIRVPERAWLRTTFDQSKVIENCEKELERALEDFFYNGLEAIQVLHRLGLRMVSEIRNRILDDSPPFQKLSSFTVEQKGSDKPLLASGQLVKSIAYKIDDALYEVAA